jgi:hypothetical protein
MPIVKRFVVLMVLAVAIPALAEDTPPSGQRDTVVSTQKKQRIEDLLEVTGALRIATMMSGAVTRQITNAVKQARPDIPPETFDMVADEVNAVIAEAISAPGGFIDLIVPVYDKYFTNEELDALIAFYNTPVGIKTVRVMPQVTQEAMQIGQRWGQSLGPVIAERVQARLREQGIEL